jgi:ribosome modulation factor
LVSEEQQIDELLEAYKRGYKKGVSDTMDGGLQ